MNTDDEPLATTLAYMTCEEHPWLQWPHDDCAGPGMPLSASLALLRAAGEIIAAARALAEIEHAGPPKPCRILGNGCDCGVWEQRNERRAEFYRLSRRWSPGGRDTAR